MYKTFQLISKETIKGAALWSLAQNAAGSDEFGEIVFGGGFAGTGVGGFVGTGSVDGLTTTLTIVTATAGQLLAGATVGGVGIPLNTVIVQQLTGVLGGPGTYQMSALSTAVQNNEPITATQALLTVPAVTAGMLGGGNAILGTGVVGNPSVIAQLSGIPGGPGVYSLSSPQSFASTGISTAGSTAIVDGDSFMISGSTWTASAPKYTNNDTTVSSSRTYWLKLLVPSGLVLGDGSLVPVVPGIVRTMVINNHGFVPGSVFGVGTEAFRVVVVRDQNTVDVYRGYAGSPINTHAAGATVLTFANYNGINLLTDIVIPLFSLTLATAGVNIAAAMTALDGFIPKNYGDLASGVRQQASLGYGFTWEYIPAQNRVFFHRPCRGNMPGNTNMQIASSLSNGAMSLSLMGGVQIGEVKATVETRIPTPQEVQSGYMDFAFALPIKSLQVVGTLSATDGPATIGSTVTYSPDFKHITLTNVGTNNFGIADAVTVKVTF